MGIVNLTPILFFTFLEVNNYLPFWMMGMKAKMKVTHRFFNLNRLNLNSMVLSLALLLPAVFLPDVANAAAVCAVVKIEIKQELTLERQAFDATMRINNALDTLSLENVAINVNFEDENGVSVEASSDPNSTTASFFIRIDRMTGISDVTGTGVVPPASTAEVHWLIIPAPGAGGDIPSGKLYYVGASLDYTLGGEPQTTVVSPDSIYVKPLPLLTLDYFLTQDVFADDAFSPEVEPAEPFTLGVRVRNNGKAAAKNVKIDSAQPKIIENEQGLLISFTIIGSHVNDQPGTNSLLTDFGTIEPNAATIGRWDMLTSLSGQFTEFTAEFSHADDLGGQLTSILQATNPHFLVRNVRVDEAGRDTVLDFLGYPATGTGDTLTVYESDNVDTAVLNQSASSTFTLLSSGDIAQYSLTTPVTAGLMYVKLADPDSGNREMIEVIRSDGKSLPLDNAWTSKTRNLDVDPPTWNYWVNFFDSNSTGNYTVTMGSPAVVPSPPKFTPMNNITTWETNPVSFPVSALDPNGDVVTLTATGLPTGATFVDNGNASGTFNWTPATGQTGIYTITFKATDAGGLATSQPITIRVNPQNDTDGDGMDDAWEIAMFGDLSHDGSGDFDGDGISDLDEYLNGHNPTVFTPAAPVLNTGVSQTGNNAYPVSGTATANAEVHLYVNNVDQLIATADAAGSFSTTVTLAQGINTLHATVVSTTEESDNSNGLSVEYIPPGAIQYYILNPAVATADVEVISLVAGNVITTNGVTLNLNLGERGVIPAVSLSQGSVITGSGAFSLASNADATDLLVPASFAGTNFVIPHYRESHVYYLLSPSGNATAQITTATGVQSVSLPQGQVIEYAAGSDTTLAGVISSDLSIVVSHTAQTSAVPAVAVDAYPVPPATNELWGVRSQNAIVAATENNTTVLVYATDGSTQQISLNSGQQVLITAGLNGADGAGSALHIVANHPVAALQVDDGDGVELSAFLSRHYLASQYAVAVDTQYAAVVCLSENTAVTLSIPTLVDQTFLCSGTYQQPDKLLLGNALTTPAALPAGSMISSDAPVYVYYEADASNDERNLLGDPIFSVGPNVAIPVVNAMAASVNQSTTAVSGLAASGTEVRLYVNSALQGSVLSGVDGSYSITATLIEGANSIHVTAWDGTEESNPSATTAVSYVIPAPVGTDLVVDVVSTTATTVEWGHPITVHLEVSNLGTDDIVDWTDTVFYLSSDSVITVDDIPVSHVVINSLVAGGTFTTDMTFDLKSPTLITPGIYYLGAVADNSNGLVEADETNNATAGTIITVTQVADLVVDAISTTATTVEWGHPITAHVEVRNQGTSYVNGHNTGFYLSADSVITTDDIPVGGTWINSLNAGGVFTADVTFNVKSWKSIVPGTYYLGAVADNTNRIIETNETNNGTAGTMITVTQVADLVMDVISTTATTVEWGHPITIHVEEHNQGTSYVNGSLTSFYLSSDPLITTSDIRVGSVWLQYFYGGDTYAADLTFDLISTTRIVPGSYYLGAIADSGGLINETDETNNTAIGPLINVTQVADLVVSALSTTATTVSVGQDIPVHLEITNTGSSFVNSTHTGFYLSTDAVITAADIPLTVLWTDAVFAGATIMQDSTITISSGQTIVPGTYYIGAMADENSVIPETDETNNGLAGTIITVQ